jgi:Acyl-CoA carboxylase epsilon subunit
VSDVQGPGADATDPVGAGAADSAGAGAADSAGAGAADGNEPRVLLQVVRGEPTAEEVAALVTVLAARSGGAPAPDPGPTSRWADPRRLVRGSAPPARGGWRASALPR